ncbi:MAG: hypothetical protein Q8S22_10860, partial [Eubacteriales bacterium]|nr:hypothetical protein [Eubacteriales bacterium]
HSAAVPTAFILHSDQNNPRNPSKHQNANTNTPERSCMSDRLTQPRQGYVLIVNDSPDFWTGFGSS